MHAPVPPVGSAFLLTQLGTHAAQAFAQRIGELDLTPPQTGLLRAIAGAPGSSQQALADRLGTPATRLVALVDGLEERGLVERRRNPADRRLHAVHLTDAGTALLADIGRVAREHDDDLLAALDPGERARLRELLAKVAADRGLAPGVHPGYRTLPPA
ncbi:MarR family winged helix-turn-helix transcriptional regulator [Actinomycetospora lemnae]|uniref:MarR family winged helix-turn-helix transcriptional regulator n=1 Tax=Actinomycetospora lemnae TaxID=3019891 RepID=A0ABT5SSW1_9PSEU|nr:MarR family winged helix-turn-helix transcriptional regulator [Actinomycetospora sp. DW7H6]MDD7965266.1 MarR family winged helix-turn-helix transcriptional regulator [Actinomycetospora sp. DW7H6]